MSPERQLLFARWISGRPVPQTRPRVVSGRVFHDRRSDAHRRHLVQFLRMASTEVGDAGRPGLLIDQAVVVRIKLVGANPTSDLDNHGKQVLDSLVQAGVLVDDDLGVVRRLEVEAVEAAPERVGTMVEVWSYQAVSASEHLRACLWRRGFAADLGTLERIMSAPTAAGRVLRGELVGELLDEGYTRKEVAAACGLELATVRRICASAHFLNNETNSRRESL